MQKVYEGEDEIIGSDILEIEMSKITNLEKKNPIEYVMEVFDYDNNDD